MKLCKVEKEDDQLILAILSKIGADYSAFVSTFHTGKLTTTNWKMPTLNSFIESLTNEHDKLVQMAIIGSSKDQTLVTGGPKSTNGKGKKKDESLVEKDLLNEPSCLKRSEKNGKEKTLCSYCGRGFHPESSCMRRTIDKMDLLLKKHNITIPTSTRKDDHGEEIEEHEETCYAMKASCSTAHAFLIDYGASNHMVASRESFSSLQSFDGPSIQMGNNSKVQAKGKGSINLEHGKFKDVLYVPSLDANVLSVYQMTHTGSPKRVIFGPDSVEIIDISTGNIIAKGAANHASKAYDFSHHAIFRTSALSVATCKGR